MIRTNPPFRAEHIGSFVRPKKLIDARSKFVRGEIAAEELRKLEDDAIRSVIAMQERVGLQIVTDGEMRRNNWRDRFFENVGGFSDEKVDSSFTFTEDDGRQYKAMPVPRVSGKLERRQTITADDFAFLQKHTARTAKATLPSPSVVHFMAGDKALAGSPYADRKAFFGDVSKIYRQEIADLAALGCRYIQIDDTSLAIICDPRNQSLIRDRGEDPEELIDDYIDAINDSIRERPEGMVVGVHMCRGNAGKGVASGGYEPVARKMFNNLAVDAFFMEYDDERSGGFEPLREVPRNKMVVLGLISTKRPDLEPADEIKRRVEEATKYIDLDQLCLSPQCGFASIYLHARFDVDTEERKLANMIEIARQIWG